MADRPLWELFEELDELADEIDSAGIDMEEFNDFGFPGETREEIGKAMAYMEDVSYHAHRATDTIKALAEKYESGLRYAYGK